MEYVTDYADGRFDTVKSIEFTQDTEFMRDENYDQNTLKVMDFRDDAVNMFESAFRDVPRLELIRPSLQLATKFMILPRVTKFFHALLGDLRLINEDYSPNYVVFQDPRNRGRQGCEIRPDEWDPDRDLPPGESDLAIRYLVDMLNYGMLLYEFDDKVDSATTFQSDNGTDFRYFARRDRNFICNGFESLTKLPQYMYDNIEDATNAQDIPRLLHSRFELAVAVVHELAHAARNCLAGKHDMEPFFGHSSIAELGFELESMMFDGVFNMIYSDDPSLAPYTFQGRRSDLKGALVLWEYPNRGVVKDYQDFGTNQAGVGQRDDPTALKPLDVGWRVPLKFLERFFDQNWWDMNRYRPRALHPDRRVGYCFRINEDAERLPVISSIAEENYVPNRYYRDHGTGDIFPRDRNVLISDVVRTRLLRDASSITARKWIMPYEPGGEYEGLSTTERRKLEIIHRLAEDPSVIGPGGRYESADKNNSYTDSEFSGHSELLLGLFIDGLIRRSYQKDDIRYDKRAALRHLHRLHPDERAELADKIAQNNSLNRSLIFDNDDEVVVEVVENLRTDPDMAAALDLINGDILLGTFLGNPMEQALFSYRTGISFRTTAPEDAAWRLTEEFRPYSSVRATLPPVSPLPITPQSGIRMDDEDDDDDMDDGSSTPAQPTHTWQSIPVPLPNVSSSSIPADPRDVTRGMQQMASTNTAGPLGSQSTYHQQALSGPFPTLPPQGTVRVDDSTETQQSIRQAISRTLTGQRPNASRTPTSQPSTIQRPIGQQTTSKRPTAQRPTMQQPIVQHPTIQRPTVQRPPASQRSTPQQRPSQNPYQTQPSAQGTTNSAGERIPMTTEEEVRMLRDRWTADAQANQRRHDDERRQRESDAQRMQGTHAGNSVGAHNANSGQKGQVPVTGQRQMGDPMEQWYAESREKQRVQRELEEMRRRGEEGDDDMDMDMS